ncbi:MAG: mandelate racemase [Alphaproteobacteria bacterium]
MTAREAPKAAIQEVRLLERDVSLRMPFRFGVVTLTEACEAFVRVRLRLEQGREGWGTAAELLAPKWFDKNPRLTNEENMEQLRTALRVARELYLAERAPEAAFARFARRHGPQVEACRRLDLNPLIAGYGPALLDRAILDALFRLTGTSFYDGMRANLPAIDAVDFAPVADRFDFDAFLSGLSPQQTIHARHTVGLADPITEADQSAGERINDGLPETLEDVVEGYGHTYFKLKVAGDLDGDIERLGRIATVLDRIDEPYYASLDGNEQYDSVGEVVELWERIEGTPDLERLCRSILYIEQPIRRDVALSADVSELARGRPVIIDESDADFDAFPRARAMGYTGISSKTCKGVYRSLINAARCAVWNAETPGRYFLSGEDLTTQPGIAVQQDLALVSLLGLTHVERNGHHYVRGMSALSTAEQQGFRRAHPDLYREVDGETCLNIQDGRLAIGSLGCIGFAVGAEPDWSTMREMPR